GSRGGGPPARVSGRRGPTAPGCARRRRRSPATASRRRPRRRRPTAGSRRRRVRSASRARPQAPRRRGRPRAARRAVRSTGSQTVELLNARGVALPAWPASRRAHPTSAGRRSLRCLLLAESIANLLADTDFESRSTPDMTTATNTQTDAFQDATAQAQELAERFVETSKKAAGEYL